MIISQELARELISYDPETGLFTWKERHREHFDSLKGCSMWNARYPGKVAGSITLSKNGYKKINIRIKGATYSGHRLAWLYMTGEYGPDQIDHENRDATDNRWTNLRDGTLINNLNKSRPVTNTSSVSGVIWNKRLAKWQAKGSLRKLGKRIYYHLGIYDNFEDAVKARMDWEKANDFDPGHGKTSALYAS